MLAIQDRDARLCLRGESIAIFRASKEVVRRPLAEVDEIVLFGPIELTPMLRAELLRRGVDVVFLTGAGSYQGRLVSRSGADAQRRVSQYTRLGDPMFALRFAQTIVAGKLRNQRAVLRRVA